MLLGAVSVVFGTTGRPISHTLLSIVDMARYWLQMANAEHVTQWRSLRRPDILPSNPSVVQPAPEIIGPPILLAPCRQRRSLAFERARFQRFRLTTAGGRGYEDGAMSKVLRVT